MSLQGKQPEDRDEWQTFWILEENLRRAKLAFADVKFFAVLKRKLEKYFLETVSGLWVYIVFLGTAFFALSVLCTTAGMSVPFSHLVFLFENWEDRLEEDRLVMERIVVLLRYIFSISPTDRDGRVSCSLEELFPSKFGFFLLQANHDRI